MVPNNPWPRSTSFYDTPCNTIEYTTSTLSESPDCECDMEGDEARGMQAQTKGPMANRPNFIDLRAHSHGPFGMPSPSMRGLPSPRLHIAGEIPPDLSPLDAFAAQSRMLARQLEEAAREGNRVSRLTPLVIANALDQGRPQYYRSASAEVSTPIESPVSTVVMTEAETPPVRPVSVYPDVTSVSPPPIPTMPMPRRLGSLEEEEFRGRRPVSQESNNLPFFGTRTELSPPPLEGDYTFPRNGRSPFHLSRQPSKESIRQRGLVPQRRPDTQSSRSYNSALAPPKSPFAGRNVSPSMDSSDDDFRTSTTGTTISPHRKLSSASGFSNSPFSPTMHAPRSPSISSEISVGGTRLPRPAFNFSRPISRQSMNGVSGLHVDMPQRQLSSDSQPSFVLADDTAHTPVSMHSEEFPDNVIDANPATSYVYSRFSLPRGKMLQRNSLIFHAQPAEGHAPPSPPARSALRPRQSPSRPPLDPGHSSYDSRPSTDSSRTSDERKRFSYERSQSSTGHARSRERPVSEGVSSSATVKPKSYLSIDCSAEDHVEKAIEYHESGALTKSTYHLRLAARKNHPTGMLLYALACRHGWGMRPNQREGVMWLRKAVDCASLEVADDENLAKDGKPVDFLEQKTRKAQFALSIYELGVSHMNGWGIDQDKVLALRCFEIAGTWGDADALAEAGFCYAQGIGCKRNLKKSAKFYRQAEAKGISMVGNSW